jgi:carbon storage regulator
MLVLTRRSGESIVIGGDIRIRVLRASGSRVRLGIEAPPEVRILREKADAPASEEPAEEESSVPRPHLRRNGVSRNVAALREEREVARVPAAGEKHTQLE